MFDFFKLCNECEKLGSLERSVLLAEKSAAVLLRFNSVHIEGVSPVKTLAAFILGSIVSDGAVNEKDYLYIYPSLVKAFGVDFDFAAVKQAYKTAKDIKKEIARYTKELMTIIAAADEQLRTDIVTLCLLVVSVDGKISVKEKRYIKQLLKK